MENDDSDKSVDIVTDQERETAQIALNEYYKGNYGPCLQHLSKLDSRTHDFKVAHNKLVAEYYRTDLKKTDAFQKGISNLFTQYNISKDKLDDLDHCVINYNQSVLLFHQRQFTKSLKIAERVYKFIEPMDDALAKQVSLLLIELQLCIRQPDKALSLITYLENQMCSVGSIKILDKNQKIPELKEKKGAVLDPAAEVFKKKLSKYKARCFLMSHLLTNARKQIQTIDQNKSNIEVLFLTANLEYLQGNFQDAMKTLASVPNDSVIYSDHGESSTVNFYNNMGVIHHAMGKWHLACYYFQKALKEDSATAVYSTDNVDKPLYVLGGSKYHELIYNLGLAFLHAGRVNEAFECLIIAVRRFHRNSRLWLRLAECCIDVHKGSNEVDFMTQKKQKELITQVIGSKDKKKVVLTTNLSKDKKYSTESISYAVPVATLEFASLCLRNAYSLLPTEAANAPVPLLLMPGVTPPIPPLSPGPAPSSPISSDEVALLKNAILAASSYVLLCLGDYVLALEYAKSLLEQSRLSGAHKLLGHLYAAEALVLLDKVNEAQEHLHPDHVKDISIECGPAENGSYEESLIKTQPPIKWFPDSMVSALAVMQYNLAVVKTLRGQLDQAAALLKQVWKTRSQTNRVPAHIIMLVLYIELKLGHADIARSLIKQYSSQHM